MDGYLFAWIIVIVFFLIYSVIQFKKCVRAMREMSPRERTRQLAAPPTVTATPYTIGNCSMYREPGCRYASSPNRYISTLDISLTASSNHLKKKEGLPTYDEVMAHSMPDLTDPIRLPPPIYLRTNPSTAQNSTVTIEQTSTTSLTSIPSTPVVEEPPAYSLIPPETNSTVSTISYPRNTNHTQPM